MKRNEWKGYLVPLLLCVVLISWDPLLLSDSLDGTFSRQSSLSLTGT